jgi:hypothetical protein
LAQRRKALGQGRPIDMRVCLGIKVPPLLPEAMVGLCHLLASALALLTLAHLCQGESEPPSWLAFTLREDVPQRLSSRVQGLGQPCAPLCPRQCRGDQAGFPHDPAEGLPDEGVPGVSRGIAGGAARALGQPPRLSAATTEGIMGARAQGAAAACEPTLATTDAST